jgi:RHS repeat-associated protein
LPSPNQTGSAQHTISYCYDSLNRVTGKAYSWQNCQSGQLPQGTAVVSYTYDQDTNGIGHLTNLTDQAGSATYSYDILGRMSSESRTIAGVTKNMSYTYNLDGSMATIKNPSGATITYTPDSAGRMLKAVDSGNPSGQAISYVTVATYGPDSSLRGFVSGQSNSFGGITNTFIYNNRLQPCRMAASSNGAIPTNCMNSWGNVLDLSYDFHLGSGDNGNVYGVTNYRDQSRNQAFTYDALNRLTSAQNAGTDCTKTLPDDHTEYWGNSYSYDAWGNLLGKIPTKCSAENLSLTAAANNQLQGGYTYDAAGNMMHDATGNLNYVYDSENRIAGAAGFIYTYDADGNRVENSNGSTTPPTGTLYWYMSMGVVGESDLVGNLKSEYIFFDGERVARKDFPGNAVSYYFSDHLKTASVITDAVGNIKSESDYYPWGGELQFTNNDSNHYKFTGKERDQESGLDDMGVRFYSSALGRFVQPDIPFADQHRDDPQSWNLYAYVRNNPLRLVDDTGRGARPADDARVQQVLDRKENFTMRQAIVASPNYSAWALEGEMGKGSLSPSLIGVAGEAVMSDRMEAQSMFGFVTFQPRPIGGGQPDLLLTYTNELGTADLVDMVLPNGSLGHLPMDTGPAQAYLEVKTTSNFNYLENGAAQTAATAAAIPDGKNAVAVLVLDQGAWNNLSKSQQQQLAKEVGGGFIQLQKNLINDAVKRATKLKTDVCQATDKKKC